jgi:gamma-glutamylcyclotransferase (GGCT)/AIG2-like uncharacterized protein YtfP
MSDYLFLYGTLLPNQAPSEVSALIRKLRKVGEGHVPGRLYDLGDYPGAILDARSETNVTGEVFALPDGQSILPDLDSYEDFDPADRRTSLFVRERHPIMLSDGRRLECWVYVYNRNPGEAPLVVGGDYSKYKAA